MIIRGPFAVIVLLLLFLSIAANLTIAGFAVGRSAGPEHGGDIERIVTLGVRAFPPPIQEEINRRTRAQRDQLRGKLLVLQRARRTMFQSMRADPFDAGALERANETLRQATADLQRASQSIVTDVLAEAPADQRRKIRHRRGPPR